MSHVSFLLDLAMKGSTEKDINFNSSMELLTHTIRKCYKQTSLKLCGVMTIFMLLNGSECFMLQKEQIRKKMTEIFLPQSGHRVRSDTPQILRTQHIVRIFVMNTLKTESQRR